MAQLANWRKKRKTRKTRIILAVSMENPVKPMDKNMAINDAFCIYIYICMDQYLLIPFLGGWTSINPSYFDVNYRGTRFWPIAIYVYWRRIKEKMPGTCVWVHSPSPTDCPPFGSNMNSSRRLSPWDPMKTPMFAAYTVIFHHFCQLNHCYSICLPVKLRHVSPFLVVKLVKP